MRGMYDKDGNIAYAGKPRASTPWTPSRHRRSGRVRINAPNDEVSKADIIALDHRTHAERVKEILSSSKWTAMH
jgi:hypothetical protein